MSRVALAVAGCAFLLCVVAGISLADEKVPTEAEAKSAILKVIRSRVDEKRQDLSSPAGKKYLATVLDHEAAVAGKVDPEVKGVRIPTKGVPTYTFPTDEKKAEWVALTEKRMKAADPAAPVVANPAAHAPIMGDPKLGRAGRLDGGKVIAVIDKSSAVVEVSYKFAMGTGGFGGGATETREVTVLVAGIDTTKMAAGGRAALPGLYYATGNTTLGGRTLMRLVRLNLTADDTAALAERKPAEKK